MAAGRLCGLAKLLKNLIFPLSQQVVCPLTWRLVQVDCPGDGSLKYMVLKHQVKQRSVFLPSPRRKNTAALRHLLMQNMRLIRCGLKDLALNWTNYLSLNPTLEN